MNFQRTVNSVLSVCLSLGDNPNQRYGPHLAEVLQPRPGLTGLWQVMGRSHRLTNSRRMYAPESLSGPNLHRKKSAATDLLPVLG